MTRPFGGTFLRDLELMMNEIYIPALSKGHAVNLLQSKGLVFRELCDRVTQDTRIPVIYIYMYMYIYIYKWYPPKTYAPFDFTAIYSQ